MADLTFTAGPIVSSLNASNAKADTVITSFLQAYYDAGTVSGWSNQQKADNFMAQLKAYILAVANSRKVEAAAETARAAETPDAWEE